MAMRNNYPGTCQNCRTPVRPQAGWVTKNGGGRWITYCDTCLPERKGSPSPTLSQQPQEKKITRDGKVFFPYSPELVTLVKSLQGAKFVDRDKGGPYWTVSTEPCDLPRLHEVAKKGGFEVDPFLKVEETEQSELAASVTGLYPFQVDGVRWLSQRRKALLGDEQGLGKTVQALISIPLFGRAMVICPAVVKYNWRDECLKWRGHDLRPIVIDKKSEFRLPSKGEVVIVNFEGIPSEFQPPTRGRQEWHSYNNQILQPFRNALKAKHPELAETTLIVDEAQKVKAFKSQRSQKVRELANQCRAVWGLTGTPFDNRPEDLYGVLSSLEMSFETFGSWDRFMRLFHADRNRWGGISWGEPDPIVPELLRRVMLRRKQTEVLPDLPKITYTNLTVNGLDRSLSRRMDEMWEEWGGVIEGAQQLPPFEEFAGMRAELAASRIPTMLEFVESFEEQDTPLVVACCHLAPLDALRQREGWKVIDGSVPPEQRQEIVKEFQQGTLKGVGISIRAAGVGITLTRASTMLFVDMDWVPGSNLQCEKRIARIGQTAGSVQVVRMVSTHPLDQHVLKLLGWKIAMIDKAVENTISCPVEAPISSPGTQTRGESQEEYEERLKRAVEAREAIERAAGELAKERAKERVVAIHAREVRKAKDPLPLTPERVEETRKAFQFMLGVCDGAVTKDGQGFNKPDAVVGHYLLTAGLETEQEVEAAYSMLTRYHRQLKGSFPLLFRK